jgi:hypothetical protein
MDVVVLHVLGNNLTADVLTVLSLSDTTCPNHRSSQTAIIYLV